MRTRTHPSRFVPPIARSFVIAVGLLMISSAPAHAISGLYLQIGGGIADYSGSELVVNEVMNDAPDLNTETCCVPTAIAGQFRLGYSIFGFGGPEFVFIGTGWDSFNGGGGFIGGGLRLYPLKLLSLAGFDSDAFPLDLSLAGTFGATLVGQDFAYPGTFWGVDVDLEYKLTSFLSAGVRLSVILPNFDDFAFTSFSNDRGRCLDGNGAHVRDDMGNFTSSPREDLSCSGRGPNTTVISPQLVFTFHFSLFGI